MSPTKATHLLLTAIFSCVLFACTTTESKFQSNNEIHNPDCDSNVNVYGETNMETLDILPPEPPKTGVERETPIVLITREEFNNRIKLSPLWDYLYDKKLQYANYGNSYYLIKMRSIINTNTHLRIEASETSWNRNQRVFLIRYGNNEHNKRNQYHHQILDQEKIEMVETLKLVFTAMSDDKANDIINTLYAQYMDKVNNKTFLSDDETIHTYLKYEGKIIAFWGKVNCEFDMFDGMTID